MRPVIGFVEAYKIWISLFGVALIVLSWFIDHSEAGSWFDRAMFRSYVRSMRGLEKAQTAGVLRAGDPGLEEIAGFLVRRAGGVASTPMTLSLTVGARMRTTNAGRVSTGTQWNAVITFATGQTSQVAIGNLDEELRQEYRDPAKDRWGGWVFWVGVAIQFVLAFF